MKRECFRNRDRRGLFRGPQGLQDKLFTNRLVNEV